MDDIGAQIGAVWNGVLAQATAAGATRMDILRMTVETASTVLTGTVDALWPKDTQGSAAVPESERNAAQTVLATMEGLRMVYEALGVEPATD